MILNNGKIPIHKMTTSSCYLASYQAERYQLYVGVRNEKEEIPSFSLLFTGVLLLFIPAYWVGANFQIASTEETYEFFKSNYSEAIYSVYKNRIKLFYVNNQHNDVKIIASVMEVLPYS